METIKTIKVLLLAAKIYMSSKNLKSTTQVATFFVASVCEITDSFI